MQTSSFRKTMFDLSPELQHQAQEKELGEFCTVYPVLKRSTSIWIIGQVCIAWGTIFVGIVALLLAGIFFSPNPPSLIFTLGIAVAGLLLLIIGCSLSLSPSRYARWQVSLWQYGFIYEHKQVCQAFRWDHIENVQRVSSGPAKVVYGCTVRRQDGYEVKLAVFSDLSELIDVVLEESARHLAPQNLRIVPSRNVRTFTALKLDRQGIRNEQEMLSWQEIREFRAKNGTILLRTKEE